MSNIMNTSNPVLTGCTIEEAISYEKLINEFSMTQDELAFKLGKSQSTIVSDRLTVLG